MACTDLNKFLRYCTCTRWDFYLFVYRVLPCFTRFLPDLGGLYQLEHLFTLLHLYSVGFLMDFFRVLLGFLYLKSFNRVREGSDQIDLIIKYSTVL